MMSPASLVEPGLSMIVTVGSIRTTVAIVSHPISYPGMRGSPKRLRSGCTANRHHEGALTAALQTQANTHPVETVTIAYSVLHVAQVTVRNDFRARGEESKARRGDPC